MSASTVSPARALTWALASLALAILSLAATLPAFARTEPYHVLMLHSFRAALPINANFTSGVSRGLATIAGTPVEIDSESLDLSRFDDEVYVEKLKEVFRLKYRERRPDVIIPTYTPALRFILDHGEELFPGVPIVFCASDMEYIAGRELPSHVTGVTVKRDFVRTLAVMRQVDPDLRHVFLVVGAGRMDQAWEADARAELQPHASDLEFTWLRGLPLADLTRRVSALPPHSAILYIVKFADANGAPYVPRAVATAMAASASAPVYGMWDTLIGSGIVGGWLATMEDDSIVAGTMAARVLEGAAPASIAVEQSRGRPIFDGRQLVKWDVPERRLPEGSRVLFREHSMWEEHRVAIIAIAVVIVLQAMLILALLANRRRLRRAQESVEREFAQRSRAEQTSTALRTRLSNFSRQSALGALATGIAHEINQPLAAIKNYAQAAKRYLARDVQDRAKIAELIGEMEGEAARAGGIIQKIRTVVRTGEVQPEPCALGDIVRDVVREIASERPEAARRIVQRIAPGLPRVMADPLQIQLVLVNLLHNALESVEAVAHPASGDVIVECLRTGDADVEVRVVDQGTGVAPDAVDEMPREPHSYSDEELRDIGAAIDAEQRRAATPRYWEDVREGDVAQPVVKGPLNITDMICWYSGGGHTYQALERAHRHRKRHPADAYRDRKTGAQDSAARGHADKEMAREVGMPGGYDVGPQRVSWLGHLMTDWAGDDGFVRRLQVQVKRPNIFGDVSWCRGKVVDKRIEEGLHMVELALAIENQLGETTAEGTSVVELPTRRTS
ncbi:MAG: ABC transporter substrate binding protein [Burkholderiales bacterium]